MKSCYNNFKLQHDYKLMATAPSGKKYWKCKRCGYKTDWNPEDKDRKK